MRKNLLFLFAGALLLPAAIATAQTTYSWTGATDTVYTTSTNWTPTRTLPATDDILQFNSGGTVIITAIATESIGELHVTNNTAVRLQAATASKTITINGGAATDDFQVAAGSSLELNGTIQIIITLGASATGRVSGDIIMTATAASVPMQFRSGAVDALQFESGSTFAMAPNAGSGGGGFASGVNNGVRFKAGSEFHHGGLKNGVYNGGTGANPFVSTQPASLVIFDPGSYYYFEEGLPSFSGRTYGYFVWRAGISQAVTGGAGALTIQNDMIFAPPPATSGKATAGTLTMNNQTGGTIVNGNLQVQSGALATGFIDGATLSVPTNFELKGNLDIQDATKFTPSTNANRTWVFNGSAPQSLNLAGKTYTNLTINNASGVTLTGSGTVAPAGTLTLTSGEVATGANTLTATNTTRTSGHINGTLTRTVTTTGTFDFPIGTAGAYSPATITLNAVTGTGTLAVSANAGITPNLPPAVTQALGRSWTITETGITGITADLLFQYLPGDITGTEADYRLARYTGSGTNWQEFPATTINESADTASLTSVTQFSTWTAYIPAAGIDDWNELEDDALSGNSR